MKVINPIPKTMMNTHQIVHNCSFLERKIDEQEQMINEQQQMLNEQAQIIEKLKSAVDGMQSVVYQMIPRTFETASSQNYAADVLLYGFRLNNKEQEEEEEDEASVDTMSTHSSMPELVDIDESDNSWVGSIKSVEHRIRISNELCGNE
jgi:uncharacterized coiled-coil protein SlyX